MLMRRCILTVLMVSSMLAPAQVHSKPVFFADFGYAEDSDRDGWPDLWRRHTDRDHPRFVKIGIVSRAQITPEELLQIRRSLAQWALAWEQGKLPGDIIPESIPRPIDAFLESSIADTCLEIIMNGGAARVEGPLFPIDPRSAYCIQAQLLANIIDPYTVQVSVLWLDDRGAQLAEQPLSPIAQSEAWQLVKISETNSIPLQASFAKIRIAVTPLSSQSIQTTVRCDRIRIDRIPRIELNVTPESRIIMAGQPFEVLCSLNEVEPTTTRVQLVARDHEGADVWHQTNSIETNTERSEDVKTTSWKLSLPESGFYTLAARVIDVENQQSHKQTTAIVLPHEKNAKASANARIGWSLPRIGNSIQLSQVPSIVEFAHVGGVKFSVWLADPIAVNNRPLSWMIENLSAKGVQCVGVIDSPREELQNKFPDKHGQYLATLLDFPQIWQPMFDPLWRRTSLFLSQYQIGWDQDSSLERHSNWQSNVTALAKHLRTIGAESSLTLPWNALSEPADLNLSKASVPWNRILSYATPSLTESEIHTFSNLPPTDPKRQWLSIDPLERSRYNLEDRVRDLTHKLVAIHQNQWEMAWISDPTDPKLAILDKSAGPDELLLPFERLVQHLNHGQDFSTVRLHDQLTGTAFRAQHEDRMLLTANKPMEARLYLGDQWSAVDVWGRRQPFETRYIGDVPTQFLTIGKWPIILSNIDRMLAHWQMDVHIENPTIENRVGQCEPLRIRLQNPESESIAGTLEVVAPLLLQEERSSVRFDARAKNACTIEVPMKLRYDASQTQEPLDIIVTFNSKPLRQFVVQRQVQVGLKDFQLETQARCDDRGSVVIDLEMVNLSDQTANFECTLVLPNRPRKKFQIIRLQDRLNRSIVIADAADLRGQSLLMRCEEISTGRILNHRIEIK